MVVLKYEKVDIEERILQIPSLQNTGAFAGQLTVYFSRREARALEDHA
jgi:hypothetical protein